MENGRHFRRRSESSKRRGVLHLLRRASILVVLDQSIKRRRVLLWILAARATLRSSIIHAWGSTLTELDIVVTLSLIRFAGSFSANFLTEGLRLLSRRCTPDEREDGANARPARSELESGVLRFRQRTSWNIGGTKYRGIPLFLFFPRGPPLHRVYIGVTRLFRARQRAHSCLLARAHRARGDEENKEKEGHPRSQQYIIIKLTAIPTRLRSFYCHCSDKCAHLFGSIWNYHFASW